MIKRGFSLYDIEGYLKVAGAEKISEDSVCRLEKEIENKLNNIIYKSIIFANYGGRTKSIIKSDVKLAIENKDMESDYLQILNKIPTKRLKPNKKLNKIKAKKRNSAIKLKNL